MKKIYKMAIICALFQAPCIAYSCKKEAVEGSGLGTIVYSVMSESNFKKINGDEWELMHGTQSTSKDLKKNGYKESVLPNADGIFIRGVDYSGEIDSDGKRSVGNIQNDSFKAHRHIFGRGGTGEGRPLKASDKNSNIYYVKWDSPAGISQSSISDVINDIDGNKIVNSKETRPRNLALNMYIKTKLKCLSSFKTTILEEKIEAQQKLINDLNRKLEDIYKRIGRL